MLRSIRLFVATAVLTSGLALTALPAGSAPVVNGRIAFNSSDVLFGPDDIYVMNADGSGRINLTNHPAEDFDADWSVDGRRLAFTTTRSGGGDIYVMNPDGSGQTNLSDHPEYDLLPTWSPDGRIAFSSHRDGGDSEIVVMNADGSGQVNVTDNDASDSWADWSPVASKILFDSDRDGDQDLWVMNADGSSPTNITSTDTVSERHGVWSPDGTRIVYLAEGDVHVMNADGSSSVNLTQTPETEYSPDWSPDGTRIVYEGEHPDTGDLEILTMNADGSGQTNITNRTGSDTVPVWQPVPVMIAKARVKEGKAARFRVTLDLPSGAAQSLAFTAVKGTAKRGKDFKATTGVLQLVPGQTVAIAKVKTKDDDKDERKERFFLDLTLANGEVLRAKGVIKDND
jgi:dipeptidyl aminopeptidase/acylaminoacyl peptidase